MKKMDSRSIDMRLNFKNLKQSNKATILGLLIASTITGIGVSGLLSASKTLSSSGSIKAINVGVYDDFGCTQASSTIDWGTPEPGDSVTKTLYVKNLGNADMTLHLATSSWTPASASSDLTVSWDRESTVLSPDEVVETIVTLDISSSITGIDAFSFQIIIEGTG